MTEPATRVRAYPNREVRDYWSRVQFCDGVCSSEIRSDLNEIGELLLGIRGVQMVFLDRYCLTVKKAASFSWEEIEQQILAIIADLEKEPEA